MSKFSVLLTSFAVFLLLLNSDVLMAQKRCETRGYLPKEFKKLYFGMPLEKLIKKRKMGMVELDKTMEFRAELNEALEQPYEEVIYYFDMEGDAPLYELIIVYKDPEMPAKAGRKLYGEPNHDETEWRFPRKKKFEVRAWTFQNKLVVTGVLPNTEWWDEP